MFPLAWALFTQGAQVEAKRLRDSQNGPGYELDLELWSEQNFIADLRGMIVNFLVWTIILIIIEMKFCERTTPRKHDF